jgi:hypothetical protein
MFRLTTLDTPLKEISELEILVAETKIDERWHQVLKLGSARRR